MMQQEQRELLQALYEEHHKILRSAAYSKGILYEEADDIVQDTFCAFIEAYADKFAEWDSNEIKAMLMRILYNRCIDHFRDRSRHPSVSMEEVLTESEFHLAGSMISADIEKRIECKETLMWLRKGILSMSRDMQDAAMLYLIEGRPIEEVSRILGISVPACRMRISRIRKYLNEWMENPETVQPKKRGRPKKSESLWPKGSGFLQNPDYLPGFDMVRETETE